LGNAVHRGLTKIPRDWQDEITKTLREALSFAQRISTARMQDDPGLRSSKNLYSAMAVATGVAGGAFGLPAILAELPITTGLILRSIADVGRSHGERLDGPDFAATCIEVFAFGGPLDEDDDSDIAFIAARIGAIEVTDFTAKVAVRYASAMAPKIAAMSVPLVGAVLGAGVNWAYMRFYQSMAQVLFTLRPIERSHDTAQVRSCFASLVKELQDNRTARSRSTRDAG
jgi:EcsC protein family